MLIEQSKQADDDTHANLISCYVNKEPPWSRRRDVADVTIKKQLLVQLLALKSECLILSGWYTLVIAKLTFAMKNVLHIFYQVDKYSKALLTSRPQFHTRLGKHSFAYTYKVILHLKC